MLSGINPDSAKKHTKTKTAAMLFVLGLVLFLPWLGAVHLFDWDEINFAEAAREMIVSKNYLSVQIDFWPFWEKPPLFIWLQALSMNIFGITEFAARFPNAICGAFMLPLLYWLGQRLRGHVFGLCWAICYLGSFLPHFYFRSGIIDPYFNAFMFGAIASLAFAGRPDCSFPVRLSALAGLLTGLAVLTKGPVGLLIVGATWSLVWFWDALNSAALGGAFKLSVFLKILLDAIPWTRIVLFLITMSLASLTWFAVITLKDGGFFVTEFIKYQIRLLQTQDAGHGGPFYYHFFAILFGCFPASFVVFDLGKSAFKNAVQKSEFGRWMFCAGLFVLVLFSLVQTKIVHYSSMTYYPLTFFAALAVENYVLKVHQPSRAVTVSFFAFVGLLCLLFAGIAFVGANPQSVAHLIRDPMARAALTEQSAYWSPVQYIVSAPLAAAAVAVFLLWRKGKRLEAAGAVAAGVSGLILLLSWLLAPSVEEIAQGPLIRFSRTAAERGCDVDVVGHKSFIHLYYGRRMPEVQSADSAARPASRWDERMLRFNGPWKKPLVLMAKSRNLDSVLSDNELKIIYQKQGFVYLYRPAVGVADQYAACGFLTE
jgi:4-amino-4-deoxy-L-arabinose transferase-like glycosyltransferase